MNMTNECRVYVACLACYVEGKLNGQWMTADELEVAWEHSWVDESTNKRILCPHDEHEEWAIHDYDMHGVNLGEHPDVWDLIELMRLMDEDSDYAIALELMKGVGADFDAQRIMEVRDAMVCYDCRSDWAQEMCEDIYSRELEALPHFITGTIDWDWVGQQLEYDYYTHEVGHTTYAIHVGDF